MFGPWNQEGIDWTGQWNDLHRPCGLYMPRGKCPICFIGELGPGIASQGAKDPVTLEGLGDGR